MNSEDKDFFKFIEEVMNQEEVTEDRGTLSEEETKFLHKVQVTHLTMLSSIVVNNIQDQMKVAESVLEGMKEQKPVDQLAAEGKADEIKATIIAVYSAAAAAQMVVSYLVDHYGSYEVFKEKMDQYRSISASGDFISVDYSEEEQKELWSNIAQHSGLLFPADYQRMVDVFTKVVPDGLLW